MPSINVDVNFFSHRKTMRLIAQLGDRAVAGLLRLWCYAAQHFPDTGALSDLSDVELEYIMQWTGTQGELVKTLVGIGFLDVVGSTCHIHGWQDHAGHLVIYRERAKKGALARHLKNAARDTTLMVMRTASSMLQANPHIEKSTSSASSMLQASLETNKHGSNAMQCSAIQCNTKKEENSVQVSTKPSRSSLTDDEWLTSLKTNPAYQHINWEVENGKMEAWLALPRNKHRKKTRQFILTWLNKIDGPLIQVNKNSYEGAYHKKVVL